MNLTEEQQLLLHAWVDGETTPTEEQIAKQLLHESNAQDDAQDYVRELRNLRELLATHGGVEMPQGLRNRVAAALDEEVERDNVISTPFLFRRWALAAVAAAIVLSLAFVYGPPMFAPTAEHSPDVADTSIPSGSGVSSADSSAAQRRVVETDVSEDTQPERAGSTDGVKHFEGAGNGGSFGSATAPEDEDNVIEELQGRRSYAAEDRGPVTVLNLDRGTDTPFELSMNMARNATTNTLLAYNDLLLVCNLYGDADLKGGADTTVDSDFEGHDFTSFDGVEIEVEKHRVEDLLAAVDRLAQVQSYGEVIVPHDMREDIAQRGQFIDEVQEVTARLQRDEGDGEVTPRPARMNDDVYDNERPLGYLPPEVQNARLRRLAKGNDASEAEVAEIESHTGRPPLTSPREAIASDLADEDLRKVLIVIRLR